MWLRKNLQKSICSILPFRERKISLLQKIQQLALYMRYDSTKEKKISSRPGRCGLTNAFHTISSFLFLFITNPYTAALHVTKHLSVTVDAADKAFSTYSNGGSKEEA